MRRRSQSELGDFLRSRREKLRPEDVGLVKGARRRVAGLRREEVAELAGIGVDWYTRLEQGRSVTPSITTARALAHAMRLSKAEANYLEALIRPNDRPPFEREQVSTILRRLIESLHQPAYVTGRRWDVLAWNGAAADIFAFDRLPEEDRNILLCVLANPATRRFFGAKWEAEAKRMVAQFRATHDLWADDPAFTELLTRLKQESPEFQAWWDDHAIRNVVSGQKQLMHPKKGELGFEYVAFQPIDAPSLKVVLYTPA